ncbi:MAG: TonB-dependent receptor [Bacteroides sp.]|nr:TonB-dependent receptor [Bacteroides sp.]MBD5375322.1 TonB-dependent receptor [Bacteroides sp.]
MLYALRAAICTVIFFVAQGPGTASAQLRADSIPVSDTLRNDISRNLQTVTVTGQRDRTTASTAPTHTLSGQRIARFGMTDIGKAIHRLPGVNLRDYGGAGGLKTVSVRGLGAAHTAVVYDGVALANSRSGEIDLARYSIDNLGSLSLIMGDNDEIFTTARSAASAATLNITSAPNPDDDSIRLSAKVSAGSFGYVSPFVRLTKGFNDRWAVGVVGSVMRADNNYPFRLRNGSETTTEKRNNSKVLTTNLETNLTYSISSGNTISTKLYYYDSRRHLPGPVVYYNDANTETLRERNAFWQSTWKSILSSKISVMTNAKFGWDASLYSDYNGKYPGGELHQNYYQREAYISGAMLWLPAAGWAVDYSADYAFNNLSSNLVTENHPFRHTILQSLSARWRNTHFTVTGKVLGSIYINRARTGEAARDARRLSPSVGISYRPIAGRNIYLRAGYKSIFRVPTFNESYFFHYGSTTLTPENTNQVNVGVTWQASPFRWLQSITMTADTYFNHVSDKIVAVPYNMFVWTVVNLEKVRGHGVDLTMSADIIPARRQSVILAANYSYQRMEPRTSKSDYGLQVAYIPRHSGGASVSYENPWVNLSLNLTATSSRFSTNNNIPGTRIAGYADTGLSIYRPWRLGRCRVEARIDALNIFNRQYEVIARYPMPGRSFRAGIKIDL